MKSWASQGSDPEVTVQQRRVVHQAQHNRAHPSLALRIHHGRSGALRWPHPQESPAMATVVVMGPVEIVEGIFPLSEIGTLPWDSCCFNWGFYTVCWVGAAGGDEVAVVEAGDVPGGFHGSSTSNLNVDRESNDVPWLAEDEKDNETKSTGDPTIVCLLGSKFR